LPFRQRPACVWTGVIDGVERAVHIEQGDAIAFDLDRGRFTRRQVFRMRHFHEFGHTSSLSKMGQASSLSESAETPDPLYINPNCNFAASVIIPWFHGGSQTNSTFASSISSTDSSLFCTSCASTGPMPQPGAVNVIFT